MRRYYQNIKMYNLTDAWMRRNLRDDMRIFVKIKGFNICNGKLKCELFNFGLYSYRELNASELV